MSDHEDSFAERDRAAAWDPDALVWQRADRQQQALLRMIELLQSHERRLEELYERVVRLEQHARIERAVA